MRKQHFIAVLLFAIVAIAFSSRPFYATTWAGTASNQMVTRAALLDAVNNGIFTANTTIPNDLRLVTREMAQQYVNIQPITSYAMNRLVPKSAFVAATPYYAQPIIPYCNLFDVDMAVEAIGHRSSDAALNERNSDFLMDIYTLYNRPFQVGDEVFLNAGSTYYPVIKNAPSATQGFCYNALGYGYWFYSVNQNAAVQVTNTNTGRQYVIDIVYPSGTTNVSICLIVDIAGSTATVQAQASTAVNTAVTIDWEFAINSGSQQLGNPFTIASGNTTSGVVNINNGSTINSMTVSISAFSPSSNGTQNYISAGQCN